MIVAADPRPWPPSALGVAVAGNGLALLLGLTAWYVGSAQARADDVAVWVNLSALALSLALAGDAVLLTSARARIGSRHRLLAVRRAERHRALTPVLAAPAHDEDVLVGLPGSLLVHLPACPLVAGKGAPRLEPQQLRLRRPCGWCDGPSA